MIRETLTAVYQASTQALQDNIPDCRVRTNITQIREWSFSMPQLARFTVANSPIHQAYLGIAPTLAKAVDLPTLLETFKTGLLTRLPTKRPIASYEILDPNSGAQSLRGIRSFILRQQTSMGNLYLMVDVSSRVEYETLRQASWEEELAQRLMPRDLAKLDVIDQPAAVNRLTTFLGRCEHDLELLVPGDEGHVHSCNAVFLRRTKNDLGEQMVLGLDLDKERRTQVKPGMELEGAFGAAGRVFRFRTKVSGETALKLGDGCDLPCVVFDVPGRFNLDQRRRYYRVQPDNELKVMVECLPEEAAAETGDDPSSAAPRKTPAVPDHALPATICDLSFSGGGLTFDTNDIPPVERHGMVRLWIKKSELGQEVVLTCLVRRLDRTPVGRGRNRTSLGLEFVIRGPLDRQGTQVVRQYVMAQQRHMLAQRSSDAEPVPM